MRIHAEIHVDDEDASIQAAWVDGSASVGPYFVLRFGSRGRVYTQSRAKARAIADEIYRELARTEPATMDPCEAELGAPAGEIVPVSENVVGPTVLDRHAEDAR